MATKLPEKTKKHLWLVYGAETGNREDGSVYYSDLVKCETGEEAILLVSRLNGRNIRRYDAKLMKVNTLDSTKLKQSKVFVRGEDFDPVPDSDADEDDDEDSDSNSKENSDSN